MSYSLSCRLLGLIAEEYANSFRDETRLFFERKVPGVEKMQFRLEQVAQKCLGARNCKKRIVLSPDDQSGRLLGAEARSR